MESHRVALPPGIRPPFEVYLNGVPQVVGEHYAIRDGALLFHKPLVQEGKLGLTAWFLGAWGVGTYKRNDEVDIRYEADGQPRLAHALPLVAE